MSTEIKIGSYRIGGDRPFVIAEAGINHNGELDTALEMILVARNAGAHAIKFQTFTAEEFVADSTQTYTYISQGEEVTEPMLDLFKRHEFPRDAWQAIRKACDDAGIMFLSTAQNRTDLELLLELNIPAIKVGSDDFTNLPLLREYRESGLPLILSSGMADISEVHQAVEAAGAFEGHPIILLVCTSLYPTLPTEVNIRRVSTLAAELPMIPIGFSDHTQGTTASVLALAYGACVFEKHFTLNHDLPGPDHSFSEDPDGLRRWVEAVMTAAVMRGDGIVRACEREEPMKTLARRSIVTICDIEPGELLTPANVALKRPGDGLPPAMLDEVLGRRAVRPLRKDVQLAMGDF